MAILFLSQLRRHLLAHIGLALVVALLVAGVLIAHATTAEADRSVHEAAHALGKNMIVLPAATNLARFHAQRFGPEGMPETHRQALLTSPLAQHIRGIETRLYGSVDVKGGQVLLVGQDGDWPSLPSAVPAVIGGAASRRLGAAIGSMVSIGGTTVAVIALRPTDPEGLDDALFVPLAAAQRILGRPGEISAMRAGGCWCRIDVAALGREVERLLPGTRAVTVAGMLAAQQGTVAAARRHGQLLMTLAAGVTAALAALIAAGNARRRSRELALVAAIGMPPRRTAGFFALEAAVTGAVGALLGCVLASLGTPWVSVRLLGAAVTPAFHLFPAAVAVSALVCALAALGPGLYAAERDPVAILREVQT